MNIEVQKLGSSEAQQRQKICCCRYRASELLNFCRLLTLTIDILYHIRHADVAQLVEQRFCKPQVVGSNPIVGLSYINPNSRVKSGVFSFYRRQKALTKTTI